MCSYLTLLCHIQIYTSISLVKDKGKEEGFNYGKLYVTVMKWLVLGNHSYSSLLKDPTQAIRDFKEALKRTWFLISYPSFQVLVCTSFCYASRERQWLYITLWCSWFVTHPRIDIRRSRVSECFTPNWQWNAYSTTLFILFYFFWTEQYFKNNTNCQILENKHMYSPDNLD